MSNEEKGLFGVIGSLIEFPLKGAKAIAIILTTLIAFGLILILILHGLSAIGMNVPFVNLNIEKANIPFIDGNKYLNEADVPLSLLDIEIKHINVIALIKNRADF